MSMLLFLLACAPEASAPAAVSDEVACASAPAVTWENWGQGFFMSRCQSCHSPSAQDRHGAPEGVDFVTHDDVLRQADRVEATVIEDGSMPLGGGLGDEDLALLKTFLVCGS